MRARDCRFHQRLRQITHPRAVGEIDQVFQGLTREAALAKGAELATERAVTAGADASSVKVVEVEDIPIAYLPGNALRVRVRTVGDIAST